MDMPRPPRPPDAADAVFHVTARVNWRAFHLEPHRCVSILYRVLRECLALFGIDLLAFALMSNHFHLVLRCPAAELFRELTTRRLRNRHRRPWPPGHQKRSVRAQFMRRLMQGTSMMIHKELGLSGHFWEKSYFARRVVDADDLAMTIAYNHLNPVEAAMTRAPEHYARSSAAWWSDGAKSPVPLLLRPPPFDLTLEELRERILSYQADRMFRNAVAEFRASGGQLSTQEGLNAFKAILKDRGVLGAHTGVRTRTTEVAPRQ
jgi:REP element-mobilizing transposase RayT